MNAYEINNISRILLTIATIGYSIVPMFADFNKTHATNPLWSPHARYHVVWQVLSYFGIGLIAQALLWQDLGNYVMQLYLVLGLSGAVFGAFFTTYLAMPLFGGKAHDVNGYLPIKKKLGPLNLSIDLNVTVFGTFVVILVIAASLIRTNAF
jgi:hypothetical protein